MSPVGSAVRAGQRVRVLLPRRGDYAGAGPRGWLADLVAGVTVAVVALPLALAFGVASGVGAAAGLITAIVAGAVAAVFGGSHLQVSGPTGAMAVVLLPIVAVRGAGVVATIALLAGVFVMIAGVLGLGRLAGFLPWPVIEGFTVGIAVVIAAQQLPLALGVPRPEGTRTVVVAAKVLARFVREPDVTVVALLALTVLLAGLLPRLHRSLPASLLAVIATTVAAEVSGHGVARIGALPHSLPLPGLPSLHGLAALVAPSLVIAALAALESLLSARVADGMSDRTRHEPDRELVGQGLANVAAGLFGGMPATGALARTAVNARSGARTRRAALIHAFVLAAFLTLAAPLVGRIPLVALAGVLLVTAHRMVERHAVRAVLRSTPTDALVFVVTATATVVLDLVTAVELGVAVAAVLALSSLAKTAQLVPDDPAVEVTDETERALLRERVLVYRLDGPLFFGAAGRFLTELTAISDVRVVLLRLGSLAMLDATGARALAEIVEHLDERGIEVVIKVLRPEHVRLLHAVGALGVIDARGHVLADLPSAMAHAHAHALPPSHRHSGSALVTATARAG
jgi:SulP family sulfate permease